MLAIHIIKEDRDKKSFTGYVGVFCDKLMPFFLTKNPILPKELWMLSLVFTSLIHASCILKD